jgi:hypothetical protein
VYLITGLIIYYYFTKLCIALIRLFLLLMNGIRDNATATSTVYMHAPKVTALFNIPILNLEYQSTDQFKYVT